MWFNIFMNKYVRPIVCFLLAFYFIHYIFTYQDWHFIDSVNLIFHEAGHVIFIWAGEFMHVLGGSLTQVLIPLICGYYFMRLRDLPSSGICLAWAGQSLINVSIYAGDAVALKLPLLGGDSSMHDWLWLLTETHLFAYTDTVAHIMYVTGIFVILAGVVVACYFSVVPRKD